MKRNPIAAIATLVRWREFQESRASDVYRQCTAAAEREQIMLADARNTVDVVQQHRLGLLQVGHLDLTHLQVTAHIEQVAHLEASERENALEAARHRQSEARAGHVDARAQTRVAGSRHARTAAHELERSEKILFDWMADLRASAKAKP